MRVLIFGDSIAYGAYDSQGGWADRLKVTYLERHMAVAGFDTSELPSIYNLSMPGELVRRLIWRLPHETVARRDVWGEETDIAFVFAVGLNDTLIDDNGKPSSTPEQFTKGLEELLAVAQLFSKKILFVGLTPVEDDDPRVQNYTCERIWQFELALRAFTKKHKLPSVRLFEKFMQSNDEEFMFSDGLHPSDEGHRIIYERVEPKLRKLLDDYTGTLYDLKNQASPKNK
jgi:lysophospholipase L1-like esterase